MSSDLIWLYLLQFLGCGGGSSGGVFSPSPAPALPGGEPGWPGSPVSYTPPWPQAVPSGLPTFPGSGWEFDEPPPAAVQQRAGQLVNALWKEGSGAFRIEQTAGRWIAYQAQIVASGKKGVVAYRMKRAALPAPTQTAARPAARPRPAAVPRPAAPPISSTPAASPPPPPAPAVPNVAPASQVQLPVLQRGAGIKPRPPSANVKLLQQRLGIPADGQFGGDTETAVMAFQRSKGLLVDGIVGPKTWTALFATGRA